jgi:hypothetical protein
VLHTPRAASYNTLPQHAGTAINLGTLASASAPVRISSFAGFVPDSQLVNIDGRTIAQVFVYRMNGATRAHFTALGVGTCPFLGTGAVDASRCRNALSYPSWCASSLSEVERTFDDSRNIRYSLWMFPSAAPSQMLEFATKG